MAKHSKRILLDSLDLIDLSSDDSSENPLPDTDPDPYALPSIAPEFSYNKGALPGYGTALPVASVDFSFPADDQKRVQAWFSGDFSHVTEPESATLKKNMTAAVKSTLDAFISNALSRNLFAAPCMIGWQYRVFDGSCVGPDAIGCSPSPLLPVSSAPDLIITSYNVYEKSLHTDVAFSQTPAQLLINIAPPEKGEDFKDIITAVEFFITKPVALFPSDMTVSGVRSLSIDGIRERVWHYSSYDSDTLLAMASSDSDFRIVASIPFSDILNGKYKSPLPLPIEAGALSRFSSLPKQSASQSGGSGSSSNSSSSGGFNGTDGWRPYLHISTPPLDLSLPEREKSVSDIYLRGVFQRKEVILTLYGSHHREHWRMIARSRGPYIRGLRRAPFRWLKVEIELPMRRDDFLEALTFSFHI